MDVRITSLPVAAAALYADLLARTQGDAVGALGPREAFVAKTIKSRRYWYVQQNTPARRQLYVGPETPELLARIEAARGRAGELAERARLVRALRAAGASVPPAPVGRVVSALAEAGLFRLRAVLVGTVAFTCYPPMLGVVLPGALGMTGDVDIAADPAVSVAVEDRMTAPIATVLRQVDPAARAVPGLDRKAMASKWRVAGLEVELLAVNRGRETSQLALPALGASGTALRTLDFLLRDSVPAVMLHDAGILVQVPDPARFAVHKLIVAARRPPGAAKQAKDRAQAAALLQLLAGDRPEDVRAAYAEAAGRGKAWHAALVEGARGLPEQARTLLARLVEA